MPFLLAFLGWGKMLAQGVMGWLSRRSLSEICALDLAIVCLVLFIAHRADQRQVAKLKAQISACSSARRSDAQAYAKAQRDAQAKNLADVAAREAQSKRISDEKVAYLNDRLSRLSDELRRVGPAAQSHPGKPGLPQVPNSPTGADGSAGLCLSPDQLLRAAQDEERHAELIDWVNQQLKASK